MQVSTTTANPSVYLPLVTSSSAPHPDIIRLLLNQLQTSVGSGQLTDEFERKYVLDWLSILISNLLMSGSGDGQVGDEIENIVEECSRIVSDLSGPAARAGRIQNYTYIMSNQGTEVEISVQIRSVTLMGDSFGTIMWSSAPILSSMLVQNPKRFFPQRTHTSASTSIPTSKGREIRPLRILELGSGTGLVGFVVARVLENLYEYQDDRNQLPVNEFGKDFGQDTIVLSDYDSNVLENLAHNIDLNFGYSCQSNADSTRKVEVCVRELDWNAFIPQSTMTAKPEIYGSLNEMNIILGADLIYDLSQVEAVYHTIRTLLDKDGTFHVVLPLRETHQEEIKRFEEIFDGKDGLGIREVEEVWGEDEFGDGGERKHRYYRIGWVSTGSAT